MHAGYLIDCPQCGKEEKCGCYDSDGEEKINFQILPRKKYVVTGESSENKNLFLRGVPNTDESKDEEIPRTPGLCSRLCWK